MSELRYLTSGESHGRYLSAILSGFPSNVEITEEIINNDLARRQAGYGRGGRMQIEKDTVQIISGIRNGKTTGAPVNIAVENKDWENWTGKMSIKAEGFDSSANVTRPRPGHADLPGIIKFDQDDVRNILERASARGTATQVAIGAICKKLLAEFGIKIISHTINIGGIKACHTNLSISKIEELAEKSELRCIDDGATEEMKRLIDSAKDCGDTVGGIVEIIAAGLPAGLGSSMNNDERIDGILAGALMGVQAIKGVEFGMGFEVANNPGSRVHDEIFYEKEIHKHEGYGACGKYFSKTNNAGGVEGGMTNGRPIIIRAAMKPIPSLTKPLRSVDIKTKEPFEAVKERADVCAVPAAGVVLESITAYIIAREFLKKFGGDNLAEIKRNFDSYVKYMEEK